MSDEKRLDYGGEVIRADLLLRGGVVPSSEGLAPVLLGGESNQFGHVDGEGGI